MTDPRRAFVLPAIVAIVLAACGGGGSSSAPTDAAAQPTSNAATEAPGASPTDAPAATPVESQSGGGGGGGGGSACDLATADEIGGILGAAGVTVQMNTPGEVSFCIYSNAAGDAVAATSWMQRGGSGSFAIWKSGAGVEQIDGLGDDAVFDPNSATLLVLKGDSIFSVTAGDGSAPEDQRIEWSKAIAEIALGRM